MAASGAVPSVCRCFCGNAWQDEEDRGFNTVSVGIGSISSLDVPGEMPEVMGMLSYSTEMDQPLRGKPIREGELWQLSTEEAIQRVRLSLYVNGLFISGDTKQVSVLFSPFTVVRNCKFQANTCDIQEFSLFKIFKVQLYTLSRCYYFGVRGEASIGEEERASWVCDISTTVRLVTQSLFPPFRILCDPLPFREQTHRRLLAGYLLHSDGPYMVSVLYCELQAHQGDQALLVLYENESCEVALNSVVLNVDAIVAEKVGINCSCFTVEKHDFSSRTLSERKLWLRAISNIKVKLANAAPSPSACELRYFREAIKEHLDEIRATLQCKVRTDALLPPSPNNTFQSELTPFAAGLWAQVESDRSKSTAATALVSVKEPDSHSPDNDANGDVPPEMNEGL